MLQFIHPTWTCGLQWLPLLMFARKGHAIPFPFVCLLIRPEQWPIVGLIPVLCICMSMHLHVQTQSQYKQLWKYPDLWGENQIHSKNRRGFSSAPKNKMVSAFLKECVRITLTAGNSLTSWLVTATSALLKNKKDLSKKQGILLVAAIQWII